jgi:hypothetical protein
MTVLPTILEMRSRGGLDRREFPPSASAEKGGTEAYGGCRRAPSSNPVYHKASFHDSDNGPVPDDSTSGHDCTRIRKCLSYSEQVKPSFDFPIEEAHTSVVQLRR